MMELTSVLNFRRFLVISFFLFASVLFGQYSAWALAGDYWLNPFAWTSTDARWISGDINNDGNADIIGVQSINGYVQFLTATSSLTSDVPPKVDHYDAQPLYVANASSPHPISWDTNITWLTGYFRGAGNAANVVGVRTRNGYVQFVSAIYINDGSGAYSIHFFPETPSSSNSITWASSTRWFVGDANGDGIDDVIGVRSNSSKVQFVTALSNGDGTFAFPKITNPTLSGKSISWTTSTSWFAGDVHGGKANILGVRNNGSRVQFLTAFANNDGTYNPVLVATSPATSLKWDSSARWFVGDADNDGIADVMGVRQVKNKAQFLVARGLATGEYFLITSATALPWRTRTTILVGNAVADGRTDFFYVDNSQTKALAYLGTCGIAYDPYGFGPTWFYNNRLYTYELSADNTAINPTSSSPLLLDFYFVGNDPYDYNVTLADTFGGATRLIWLANFTRTCNDNNVYTYLPPLP